MGIPGHLTHLLRNLYAGQEAMVKTGHGTTEWFQIGKRIHQGCMIYSVYKLNKQGDINIQPWHTPSPIWNQSVVPCPVLTVASWPAYRFLARQVKWSGIPISFKNFLQFVVIHTAEGFSVVNEAKVGVFLEFSCFFYDPMDVGNLTSGLSAFSKSSLYIWKFLVHELLYIQNTLALLLLSVMSNNNQYWVYKEKRTLLGVLRTQLRRHWFG